jgi:glutamate-1-semialdehyde 2,1-aminomutase
MAAGFATVHHLIENESTVYEQLEAYGAALAAGVAQAAKDAGVAVVTNRVGAMVTWFFTEQPVTDFASAAQSDTVTFGRFHRAMLESGVWLPPSQFEAAFFSTAHTTDDLDATIDAARGAFDLL